MTLARFLDVAMTALLVAGCASAPTVETDRASVTPTAADKPPAGRAKAPVVLTLLAPRAHGAAGSLAAPPILVEDGREGADPHRIGEIHAPGGGTPPMPPPSGVVFAVIDLAILLSSPTPTGQYLVVNDPDEVPRSVEHSLEDALLKARRHPLENAALDATLRTFWIRPSWTTTCDVVVDLRLRTATGQVPWQTTLESRVDKFEGLFTVTAFERVARLALDRLTERAAAAFGSSEFGAAIATHPAGR